MVVPFLRHYIYQLAAWVGVEARFCLATCCSALWLFHPEMLYTGCAFRTTPDAQSRKMELLNTFLLWDAFHFPVCLMIFWGKGYLLVVFHKDCCVIWQVLIQTQFIFVFQDPCLALSKILWLQTSALNLGSRRHSELSLRSIP